MGYLGKDQLCRSGSKGEDKHGDDQPPSHNLLLPPKLPPLLDEVILEDRCGHSIPGLRTHLVPMSTRILWNPRTAGRNPNWFTDQRHHSTVQLCRPPHRLLRARVSLWLWPLRQLHTARSQFTTRPLQGHHRSNTSSGSRQDMLTKEVNAPADSMCSRTKSANRAAASWEKQIWHLGSRQLRASALTPRLLCTGFAARLHCLQGKSSLH